MRRICLSSASIVALAVAASPVAAQDRGGAAPSPTTTAGSEVAAPQPGADQQAAENSEIVVTGSRISRLDYVAQSPIVTTDKEAIQNASRPTVDSYLSQLPQFQPGTGGSTNTTGGGNVGQATLNLRGLGSQRNLVLLDGRRAQPGNAQSAIDINTIPAAAIANVEVITGGASATYGSDALSGVVNFKLLTRYDGVALDAQMLPTSAGDGTSRLLSITAGRRFLDDRLSVVAVGDYLKRDSILLRDRPVTAQGGLTSSLIQGYFVPDGANLPTAASINSVFGRYGFAAGTVPRTANLAFNDDGTLFRNGTPGTNYRGSTSQPFLTSAAGGIFYNGGYYNLLQIPLERYNGYANVEFKASPAATIYMRGIFSRTSSASQGSPPTLVAPWQLNIPVTNPFIPADLRTVLASRAQPNAAFLYNGRFWQAGPRAFENRSTTYQILAGVRGDIGTGLDLHYDVYAETGKTTQREQQTSGVASLTALRALVNAADGGASLCAGGYNPFGLQPLSQACIAYVSRSPINRTEVGQDRVEGTLTGRLFKMPAGDVKFSVNADYQHNSYTFNPDPAYANNDISSITSTAFTKGAINVVEGSAELFIPLLSDLPLIRSLNTTLGYRYSHYDTSGSVSSYKADFDWQVFGPLMLRGGYQRAVRAPNIGELYLAGTQSIANIGLPPSGGDPCDARSSYRTGANAAQVLALCQATGLNPAIASTFTQFTGAIVSQTSGNDALKPEKANTFTVGAVLRPSGLGPLLRRFSLSVDYYNISISGAISSIAASTSLNKCFNGDGSNPTYSATNYYCTLFQRDPTSGQFTQGIQPFLNLGGFRTSGIDIQADWIVPAGATSVALNVGANYLDKFEIQNLPGSPFQDFSNTVSTTTSYPRWKVASSLAWRLQQVNLGMRWRYIAAMSDVTAVTAPSSQAAGVPAISYFDLFANIIAGDRMEFRLGVSNLTDKQPPVVGGVLGQVNGGTYDLVGRTYNIGAKVRF